MKVLQLGKFYPPAFGGIETVTQTLTEGLNAAGVPCDVLCASLSRRTSVHICDGYKVIRAGSLGTLFSVSMCPMLIVWLIRIHRAYDVIHVHLPNPLAALAIFLIRRRTRVVLHWHADVDPGKFRMLAELYAPLSRWLIRRATAVVGATHSHIECSDYSGEMRGKSTVIPYPFQPHTAPLANAAAPHDDAEWAGRFIILAIGRLIYYKGFKYLVEAAGQLPDDCMVLIAGSGPLGADLAAQIAREGLQEKVRLMGPMAQSHLDALLARCDVFCFPSTFRGEMFGMAQVEAMSYGKPVVGTKIPRSGVHEVNIDGVTGISVPPMDAQAIARAILTLRGDSHLRAELGRAGKARVRTVYDMSVVIPQFVALFDQLAFTDS